MLIETLGSGSSGNCYIVSDNDGHSLILDAGIKSKDIKAAMNYDFSSVDGVLISHSHRDHSFAAEELELLGLDVYRPYLIDGGRDRHTFGKWAVQTFGLPHDGCPNCGFYIRHTSGFQMLYLTDFEFCKYVFTKAAVDFILIEVNWEERYIQTESPNFVHKCRGHASFDVTKEFIRVNATDNLKAVVICHTSYAMDVPYCLKEIRAILPENVVVDVAEKGRVVEI